jgi:2-isopropylmalate synthase
MSTRIQVFDTTLRDGEQSPGCSMDRDEKVRLARQLERLGVDVIEAGFPVASPGEREAVRAVAHEVGCGVAALCRTRPADIEAAAAALRGAQRPRIHTFLATSDIHLESKLRLTREQALAQAVEGVRLARALCDEVEFSAEDASRSDGDYLLAVCQAVHAAGASVINLPDTVGYALPHEYAALVARLVRALPGVVFSVHCHNDLGLAVANSLAGVQAGARQVEVTVNGIGERAGNAALEELVMSLHVRQEALGLHTGVRHEQLTPTSRLLAATTGVWPQPNKAIVGRNAFAHEAGIHQHGVLSNPLTYEIMTPASVGLQATSLVLGKHAGRHAVAARLHALGIHLDEAQVERVTAEVKALADHKKFVYDDDLLALLSADPRRPARLLRYQSVAGNHVLPTATVEVELDGQRRSASAVGNGPLDAALKAADAALGLELELLEMHTRAVTAGTDALAEVVVRVRHAGHEAVGQAANVDTLEATLRAYLSAVSAVRVAQGVPA